MGHIGTEDVVPWYSSGQGGVLRNCTETDRLGAHRKFDVRQLSFAQSRDRSVSL